MCTFCGKTFGHKLGLYIHTKTFHKQKNESQRPAQNKENLTEVEVQNKLDLPFKCTECKYQDKNREELIKHIETKHASILSPAKVIKPIPAPRKNEIKEIYEDDVITHMERRHQNKASKDMCDVPPTKETSKSYDCRKCGHKAKSSETLANHLKVKHTNYMNLPNWFIVGDSHLNSVKPRMVEKASGGKLFGKGFNHPKEGRAYCSTKEWPNSKFPNNNHKDLIPKVLEERVYKGGIILCPGNDISNIANMDRARQLAMAEQSALNMVGEVEKALQNNSTLEKMVMMEYPPRADSKQLAEVTTFANEVLHNEVNKSKYKEHITVGSFKNLRYNNDKEMVALFGPNNSNPRYDGVHLRGRKGSWLYTESIMTAVSTATSNRAPRLLTSSTRNPIRQPEVSPITTQNRYEVLN